MITSIPVSVQLRNIYTVTVNADVRLLKGWFLGVELSFTEGHISMIVALKGAK